MGDRMGVEDSLKENQGGDGQEERAGKGMSAETSRTVTTAAINH